MTHRSSIALGAFSAGRPALARGTVGAGRAGSALMTWWTLQAVSSRPAGATTLTSRTRFALLTRDAGGA